MRIFVLTFSFIVLNLLGSLSSRLLLARLLVFCNNWFSVSVYFAQIMDLRYRSRTLKDFLWLRLSLSSRSDVLLLIILLLFGVSLGLIVFAFSFSILLHLSLTLLFNLILGFFLLRRTRCNSCRYWAGTEGRLHHRIPSFERNFLHCCSFLFHLLYTLRLLRFTFSRLDLLLWVCFHRSRSVASLILQSCNAGWLLNLSCNWSNRLLLLLFFFIFLIRQLDFSNLQVLFGNLLGSLFTSRFDLLRTRNRYLLLLLFIVNWNS